jgi:hypothetical protein
MTRKEKIQEEVEKTLNVLNEIPNIEANPFLFTRLKAAIEDGTVLRSKWRQRNFVSRPVILCIILLLNLITVIFLFQSKTVVKTENSCLINSLSKDYQISQTKLEKINQE